MKLSHAPAVLVAAFVALVSPARADMVSILATDDGYVHDEGIDGTWDFVDTVNQISSGLMLDDFSPEFSTEDRGVVEFDITSVPAGATITSATLVLYTAGGTDPSSRLHAYAGNGVVDLSDATVDAPFLDFVPTAPVNEPNFFDVPTAFVQGLADGGEPFAGFMIQVLSENNYFGYRALEGTAAWRPRLEIEYTTDALPMVSILANADGYVEDEGLDGTWDFVDTVNQISSGLMLDDFFPEFNTGDRGVVEFDITSVPAGATITSATLVLYSSGGSGAPSSRLHAYVGNGVVDLSDATVDAAILDFTPTAPVNEPNFFDVPAAFVQGLVDGGESYAGFMIQILVENNHFSYRALEGTAAWRPRLEITYQLGTSFVRGDANGDSTINIADGIHTLSYLFSAGATNCLDAQDWNDDGAVNIADAISTLSYIFDAGTPPAPPIDTCGVDPTDDALECDSYVCP